MSVFVAKRDVLPGDTPSSQQSEYGDFRDLLPGNVPPEEHLQAAENPGDPETSGGGVHRDQPAPDEEDPTDQNTDALLTSKRPVVVDPESVLAEQMESAKQTEELTDDDETPENNDAEMLTASPQDSPAINSEGFLTVRRPPPPPRLELRETLR